MRLPTKCASGVPFAIDSMLHRRCILHLRRFVHSEQASGLCLADQYRTRPNKTIQAQTSADQTKNVVIVQNSCPRRVGALFAKAY